MNRQECPRARGLRASLLVLLAIPVLGLRLGLGCRLGRGLRLRSGLRLGGGLGLALDLAQPRVLARRLVEVQVDDDAAHRAAGGQAAVPPSTRR